MDGGQAMERRTFMAQVFGGILTAPLAAEAQSVGKVWRARWTSSWRTHHRQSVPPSRQRASFPSS